jgi:hypothetical protein
MPSLTKTHVVPVETGRTRQSFSYEQDRWIHEREIELIEQDINGRVFARRKEWRE